MLADRPTFCKLVDALRPKMEKQTTNFKRHVPVEKRVAAALYHYGHGGSLEDIADQFDISLALKGVMTRMCEQSIRKSCLL